MTKIYKGTSAILVDDLCAAIYVRVGHLMNELAIIRKSIVEMGIDKIIGGIPPDVFPLRVQSYHGESRTLLEKNIYDINMEAYSDALDCQLHIYQSDAKKIKDRIDSLGRYLKKSIRERFSMGKSYKADHLLLRPYIQEIEEKLAAMWLTASLETLEINRPQKGD